MEILLRARHWQLFLLTGIISPFTIIYAYVFRGSFLLDFRLLSALGLLSFLTYALWQYALVRILPDKMPHESRINITPFLVLFYINIAYKTSFSVAGILSRFIDLPDSITNMFLDLQFLRIGFMPVTSLWSYAISIYFSFVVSKMVVTTEEQKKVSLGRHFGTLLGLLFFAIGVWFIQPRVNKLFGQDDPNKPLDQGVTQ